MNSIELKENKGFEFILEPNFLQERKIKSEMVELAGSWDKLAELDTAIVDNYQMHLKLNKDKFGVEEFVKLHTRYLILEESEADTEELREIKAKINNNRFYNRYLILLNEKSKINNYAYMIVCCLKKPDGFDFRTAPEETLSKIWLEFITEKKNTKKDLKA